jgi:hypothetical protein
MRSWRSCNLRRLAQRRRKVYEEAKEFHHRRVGRLWVTARTDKLENSGFVRRLKRRSK